MQSRMPNKDVVLLGIGHTNAHIVRMWATRPIRGARLTCISDFPVAAYSGMLPGVLAGDYPSERMEIDLERLCTAAGATFIQPRVIGLDVAGRRLMFKDRQPLAFGVLSIGIGSVPSFDGVQAIDDSVLAIKPMQTFIARFESRLRDVQRRNARQPVRIVVVGGGTAGVEIAFCLPRRIEQTLTRRNWELSLVHAGEQLVGEALPATRRLVHRELKKRGATLYNARRVRRVRAGNVELDDGSQLPADVVLWATSASAPPLLRQLNLPVDRRGFLLTDDTLRTTAGAPVFAVGDTGSIESQHVPKAGVYAVRQAPILWRNIQRSLRGAMLARYHPQRRFLKLLNTGDGRAIGEYPIGNQFGWSSHDRWMWKLKDFIDTRFVKKYQQVRRVN